MTRWRFTVENSGADCPEALRAESMTLYFECELQFFTKEEELKPKLIIHSCTIMAIPLRLFQVNTETVLNHLLSKIHIHSPNSENLDKKGFARLALSLASTKVPLRVRLTADEVMPLEEIERMKDATSDEHQYFESVEDIEDEDDCCAICLEKLSGTKAFRVGCKHIYHKSCFDDWYSYAGVTCPMCRSDLWGEKGPRIGNK